MNRFSLWVRALLVVIVSFALLETLGLWFNIPELVEFCLGAMLVLLALGVVSTFIAWRRLDALRAELGP